MVVTMYVLVETANVDDELAVVVGVVVGVVSGVSEVDVVVGGVVLLVVAGGAVVGGVEEGELVVAGLGLLVVDGGVDEACDVALVPELVLFTALIRSGRALPRMFISSIMAWAMEHMESAARNSSSSRVEYMVAERGPL